MATPSAKEILDEIFSIVNNLSDEAKAKFKEHCYKYIDHPVFEIVSQKVNSLSKEFGTLHNVLGKCGLSADQLSKFMQGPKPIIVLCPDNYQSLRIYENLIVDKLDAHYLASCSTLSLKDTLSSFIKVYEDDAFRDKKWANPVTRTNSFVDMPTARAIERYFGLSLKADKIRDLAIALDNYRKPLEVSFAETPQDFFKMYNSGPTSCMGYAAGNSKAWEHLIKNNMYPPSFYAWYPHTKGAYIERNGVIVARVICFKEPDGKWVYGRIYSATPEYSSKFVMALNDLGIYSKIKSHKPPEDVDFMLPSLEIKGSVTRQAPWPYFDDMDPVLSVKYLEDSKEFHVVHVKAAKEEQSNIPQNTPTGFIRSIDFMQGAQCAYCGKRGRMISSNDGVHTFCSAYCATRLGYVEVMQGNGVHIWEKPSELHILIFNSDVRFSTLRAARDNNYDPVTIEGLLQEEGEIMVVNNGERYTSREGWNCRSIDGVGYNKDTFDVREPTFQKNVAFDYDKKYIEIIQVAA